jgi:putative oxidoreductase
MKAADLIAAASRASSILSRAASGLQSPLLLVVRLYWGWQFFGTGTAKFGDLATFTQRFAEWGIPMPRVNVLLAAGIETVCGLLLCVGLASRIITLPLIFTMIVAYLTAENEALRSFFSDPDKFVSASPFQFMFACVLVFVFGPGAFSLDYLIGKKFAPSASDAKSA